jgi:hypothetical protein
MTDWQKSSYCGQGESCVHIATSAQSVQLMESSDPAGAVLTTTRPAFAALAHTLKQQRPA